MEFPDAPDIFHFQRNDAIHIDLGLVAAIGGQEFIQVAMNAEVIGEFGHTASAIATHTSFHPIGIIVFHFEIISFPMVQEHQAVCTNAEAPVAKFMHLFIANTVKFTIAVIDQDEIIAGALVFMEGCGHNAN